MLLMQVSQVEEVKDGEMAAQTFDGSVFLLEDLHAEGFGDSSKSKVVEIRISPCGENSHKIIGTHTTVLPKKLFSWCVG